VVSTAMALLVPSQPTAGPTSATTILTSARIFPLAVSIALRVGIVQGRRVHITTTAGQTFATQTTRVQTFQTPATTQHSTTFATVLNAVIV